MAAFGKMQNKSLPPRPFQIVLLSHFNNQYFKMLLNNYRKHLMSNKPSTLKSLLSAVHASPILTMQLSENIKH